MLESILNREVTSAAAIYCLGSQKSEFIFNLIDRKVFSVNQLIFSQFAEVAFLSSVVLFHVIKSLNILL